MHVAAAKGHAAVVELLAGQGADIAAADLQDLQAMYSATINGHAAVVDRSLWVALEHGGVERR